MAAQIPARRLGEPEEVAAAAEFLFANDYLNGRTLEIDGGQRL
jgi:3-oxoacyl-[acyl-carrier protein] reductase